MKEEGAEIDLISPIKQSTQALFKHKLMSLVFVEAVLKHFLTTYFIYSKHLNQTVCFTVFYSVFIVFFKVSKHRANKTERAAGRYITERTPSSLL